jgi:hypothetical protein
LPVLQAYVERNRRFDIDSLDDTAFKTVLDGGVGAILSYVTAESDSVTHSIRGREVHAADLTMRLVTGVILDTVEAIAAVARQDGLEVTLMKGCASALRYYPEPHMRTMGDVDLLVSEAQREPLEHRLRDMGFVQPGDPREALTRDHHHSLPFRHRSNGLYLEVHTRPYPPHSPLSRTPGFTYDAVTRRPESVAIGAETAQVMNHEQQLVYTATRWAEMINAERGVFPLLDASLLVRARNGHLDWDEVCRLADDPWAAGALLLMLTYLDRWQLAVVPSAVLKRLGHRDRVTNAVVRRVQHALVTAYVMRGRPAGAVLTASNRRIVWSTLAAAKSPWKKLLELPLKVLLPTDDEGRFDGSRIARRLGRIVRRVRG